MPITSQSTDHDLLRQIDPDHLNVLFIRHGQAGPGEAIGQFQGKPLTPLGLKQARRVAKRLAPIPLKRVYCSDFTRSYQTAKAIIDANPTVPWEIRAELREIASFHLPGYPPARTREQHARLHQQRQAAEKFIRLLRRHHRAGEIVAVVAHGGINRLVTSLLAGIPLRQSIFTSTFHTSITLVEISKKQRINIRFLNCTRHLPNNLITEMNL